MKVAHQVFSYDEDRLADTLDAWATQHIPEWMDVDHQVGVTPSADPIVDDETWVQAETHGLFDAYVTDSGKLTSRNQMHTMAFEEGYDAVVVSDADAPPLDDDVLAKVVAPLDQNRAVATMAEPVYPRSLVGQAAYAVHRVAWRIKPHIHGQCSGFTRGAWEQAGPFDEHIDQTSINDVWFEEEVGFYRRLEGVGPVEKVWGARVHNDVRRWECRIDRAFEPFGIEPSPYCERHGQETFAPSDRKR